VQTGSVTGYKAGLEAGGCGVCDTSGGLHVRRQWQHLADLSVAFDMVVLMCVCKGGCDDYMRREAGRGRAGCTAVCV
jgi:hypothetical protein